MILKKSRGNVFMITFLLLTLAIAGVGIVMSQTATVAQNANRSRQFQGAQAAAAGAVDYAYAVWYRRTNVKHDLLNSSELTLPNPPSFTGTNAPPGTLGFEYTTGTGSDDGTLKIQALDKYGVPISSTNAKPDMVIGPVHGYDGWWGRTYIYAATAKLRVAGDPSAPVAGARRLFYYTEVPLFQCMFFFQHNLEIYNPANMIITGLIHSNQNLYLSTKSASSNLKIRGQASYVTGTCFKEPPTVTGSPADASGTDYPPTWDNGGQAAQLHKVLAMSPMGSDLDQLFSNTAYTSNPNVTGSYHELVEVPVASATDPIETDSSNPRRLYNIAAKSGLIIKVTGTTGGTIVSATAATTSAVAASTIAITTLDSNGLPIAQAGKNVLIAAGAGITLPTTEGTADYNAAIFAFSKALSKQQYNSTTKFYDAREGTLMNVVNVDVALLNQAINASVPSTTLPNYNDVIYISDDSTAATTYPNAVRLKDGAVISNANGLTIASQNPVYVQGDYNTGSTLTSGTDVPSNKSNANNDQNNYTSSYTPKATAIIADAITLLSNGWSDANSYSGGWGTDVDYRPARNTTYNVALLGGYLNSDSVSSTYYSGGAINYPRFLEAWSNVYCTYFGSMVELFPSTSQKPWIMPGKTGEYYSAPLRRFNFDTNFASKSPPGSTNAISLSRGIWTKW